MADLMSITTTNVSQSGARGGNRCQDFKLPRHMRNMIGIRQFPSAAGELVGCFFVMKTGIWNSECRYLHKDGVWHRSAGTDGSWDKIEAAAGAADEAERKD